MKSRAYPSAKLITYFDFEEGETPRITLWDGVIGSIDQLVVTKDNEGHTKRQVFGRKVKRNGLVGRSPFNRYVQPNEYPWVEEYVDTIPHIGYTQLTNIPDTNRFTEPKEQS